MIKLTDLRFGQELYTIGSYSGVIYKNVISGFVKMGPGIERIYLNNSENFIHLHDLKKEVFFTREKAEAYLKRINDKKIRFREHMKRGKQIAEELRKNFKSSEYTNLIGKAILIKVEDGKWAKSDIEYITLTPGLKPRRVFVDRLRKNFYFLENEGKNWKFWNKLDELKLQREQLEIEIKKLENN